MITKRCFICRKEFETYPSRLKKGLGKYCSKVCSDKFTLIKKGQRISPKTEFQKGNKINVGINNPMYGISSTRKGITFIPILKCLTCKKDFKSYINSKGVRKRFCSKSCSKFNLYNPMWKNGISEINDRIRHTKEYILWRTAVFMRDDYTCQGCGERGGRLEADHIKPFSLYPELRFAIDNGRTLCHECHKQTDTYGWKLKWRETQ